MSFYHYYCEENNRTVEVSHPMKVRLKTWGEVCESAGIDPGKTSADVYVVKLLSKPLVKAWRVKGLDKDTPSSKLSF